jgi:tripartite-type tricarboxylate transporter receptor subunit TctC
MANSPSNRRSPLINRRSIHRSLLAALAAAGLVSAAAPALAQQAGAPLRIVVPYPPGGSSDRAARLLAEALQPRLGQTVIVENIVGAGGRLAMRQLAGLPADAPVLVLVNPALMVVAPLVYKNNGYDPERDFQPVSQVSRYEFAAAVGPAVPVRELNHLMAWLKANPNQASIGVPATGSLPHFFALMMGQSAQVPAQVVGYKGSAPLSTDLIGGHVPVAVDTLDTLLPLHEGGKLRILATSGATRAAKELPTFQEAGLKLSASGWNVLYAKAGMPATEVQRLSGEVAAVMKQPELRDKFIALKAEPVSATREQTTTMLRDFKSQWVPVIQKAGLQFE